MDTKKESKGSKLDPDFLTPARTKLLEKIAATAKPIKVDTSQAL